MKVYNKKALRISITFLVIYGIVMTLGSPFLLSWGSNGLVSALTKPFLYFPVDWAYLIADKSLLFLALNIMFWSGIVYIIVLVVEKVRHKEKM